MISIGLLTAISCSDDDKTKDPLNPDTAPKVEIDRFSDAHATLMKRSENSDLPAPNEPINFDQPGFITQSLGPNGQVVRYYNFDVQPLIPAPIYILVKGEENIPVKDQLSIIGVIPGDPGYNDFWQKYLVHVPDNYVANTATSINDIWDLGEVEALPMIFNCPVVPYGSTAAKRFTENENTELIPSWYNNQVAYYFSFEEKILIPDDKQLTPTSPIYVTFNVNPDESDPNSGPASGIRFEENGIQSHNVVETVPSHDNYSALWAVSVYDNADFENVSDLESVKTANILMEQAMYVNCPLVYEE